MSSLSSWQLIFFLLVAGGAAACWWFYVPWEVAGLLVLSVIVYLGAIFIFAANRKEGLLPELGHSIWIFLFLFLIVLFAFANMYIQSRDIIGPTESCEKQDTSNEQNSSKATNDCDSSGVLTDRTDAIYYSLMTLTTTGYGEFRPKGTTGRRYVIYQLVASALLIAGGLAFLISRLASLKESGASQPSATTENIKEILEKRTFKLADNATLVFYYEDTQKFDFLDNDGKWKELTDAKKLEEANKKIKEQTT